MEANALLDYSFGVSKDCIVAGCDSFMDHRHTFSNYLQGDFNFPPTNPNAIAFDNAELVE